MPYTLLLEKHVRSGLVRLRQLRIGLQIGGCIFNRLRHRRLALTDKRIDSRVGELSCPQIALLPYRVCDSHAEPGKGIVVVIGSVAPPRLPYAGSPACRAASPIFHAYSLHRARSPRSIVHSHTPCLPIEHQELEGQSVEVVVQIECDRSAREMLHAMLRLVRKRKPVRRRFEEVADSIG